MATVVFSKNLSSFVPSPPVDVNGGTVEEAIESALRQNERLRSYVKNDQGVIRSKWRVFIDGRLACDPSESLSKNSTVYLLAFG